MRGRTIHHVVTNFIKCVGVWMIFVAESFSAKLARSMKPSYTTTRNCYFYCAMSKSTHSSTAAFNEDTSPHWFPYNWRKGMRFTVTPRYWVCLIGTNTLQAQRWHVGLGSKFLCRLRKFFFLSCYASFEAYLKIHPVTQRLNTNWTYLFFFLFARPFAFQHMVPAMQLPSLINDTGFVVPWHVAATILDANTVGELDVWTGKEGVRWIPALPDCQSTGLHNLQSLVQSIKSPISGPCPHQTLSLSYPTSGELSPRYPSLLFKNRWREVHMCAVHQRYAPGGLCWL